MRARERQKPMVGGIERDFNRDEKSMREIKRTGIYRWVDTERENDKEKGGWIERIIVIMLIIKSSG